MVIELLALLLGAGTTPPRLVPAQQRLQPAWEQCIAVLRAGSLEPQLEALRAQALETGDEAALQIFIAQQAPGITIRVMGESNALGLNAAHFRAQHRAGTPLHRFFSLAQQGFYLDRETDRLGTAEFPGWIQRTESSAQGRVDRRAAHRALKQWQRLRPQLKGLARDLAEATIHHLSRVAD